MYWFALAWLCSWPLQALGAEIALVGIHDAGLSADQQHELVTALAAGVELSGRHTVVRPDGVRPLLAGREDLVLTGALESAGARLMSEGRALYQQASHDEALIVLEAAVASLQDAVRHTRSTRTLWEAEVLLGTVAAMAGRDALAYDALHAAAGLHSAREPDPANTPPQVVRLYRDARELLSAEQATLTLAGVGSEDEVWINGRRLVDAPGQSTSLPTGSHHVHVRSRDGRQGYATVEMVAGQDAVLEVSLAMQTLGLARAEEGARRQQTTALYRALGELGRVPMILLMGRVDGVMHLQAFVSETQAFSEPVVLSRRAGLEVMVASVAELLDEVDSEGAAGLASHRFGAIPLAIDANHTLAELLLRPTPPAGPPVVPVLDDTPEVPSVRRDLKKPMKWPVYVGIGVGSAAVVAGVTALAIALGGKAQTGGARGTLVVGPPR